MRTCTAAPICSARLGRRSGTWSGCYPPGRRHGLLAWTTGSRRSIRSRQRSRTPSPHTGGCSQPATTRRASPSRVTPQAAGLPADPGRAGRDRAVRLACRGRCDVAVDGSRADRRVPSNQGRCRRNDHAGWDGADRSAVPGRRRSAAPVRLLAVRRPARSSLPILIHVGDAEVILDDSTRFARRARLAGVDVTLEIWDEMPHVFQAFAGLLPEADQAVAHIGSWLREHVRATR